jgi:hypothetical protein
MLLEIHALWSWKIEYVIEVVPESLREEEQRA